jgi:hypothetical protein
MRKWIICLFFLWVSVFPASAAFYDNSAQYLAMSASKSLQTYIDTASVVSATYYPPFYIIQADIIYHDQSTGLITRSTERYYYDSDAGTVSVKTVHSFLCDEDGNVTEIESPISLDMKLPLTPGNDSFKIADLLFSQIYHIPFSEL